MVYFKHFLLVLSPCISPPPQITLLTEKVKEDVSFFLLGILNVLGIFEMISQ